jgi:HSP20 family protein
MEAAMNLRTLMPFSDNRATPMRPEVSFFGPLQREIDRLFDDFARLTTLGAPGSQNQQGSQDQQGSQNLVQNLVPRLDVTEADKEIVITAEMPGLERKDVEISIDDDILTIRGEKKVEAQEGDKDKNYQVAERAYGVFLRMIQLPPGIDPSKIQAVMSKGVLKITLPKPARSETRKIEVKEAA